MTKHLTNPMLISAFPVKQIERAPLSLPFPIGYVEHVWCRGTNFRKTHTGAIICTLHNADGNIEARISRPDLDLDNFYDWIVLRLDVVTTLSSCKPVAEIMNVHRSWPVSTSYLDLLPRAACALPNKLDEFRHLVQHIQLKELRQVVDIVFSDPQIFLPFLTRFAGSECYTYPSGLLVRAVDAAKHAMNMGFQTQEEADVVLTAAILYDIGRIRDGNLMSERLRATIGFVPHPKSRSLLIGMVTLSTPAVAALLEAITTGYCERYQTLQAKLKQNTALAKIDRLLRKEGGRACNM